MPTNQAPPAQGVRQNWHDIPEITRTKIEQWLGSPVVKTESQTSGFSPGVASKLLTENGRSVFLKAVSPEINPTSPAIHRREAEMMKLLPLEKFAPAMLFYLDDTDSGWVVLIFENIDGHNPSTPWQLEELKRVMTTLVEMSTVLNADLLPDGTVREASTLFANGICGWNKLRDSELSTSSQIDEWTKHNLSKLCELEKLAPEAVQGRSLLHFDIRADNILLTDKKVWVVDWPHVCIGADWLDVVLFAPSVKMQDGLPPEELIQLHPSFQKANPDDVTAAIASVAGFFSYNALLPPPPGLPTLRQFMNAQGIAARDWLRERIE